MSRFFFLGATPGIDLSPEQKRVQDNYDTKTLLAMTGHNSGNLLIGHSVFRHLKPTIWSTDYSLPPEQIEKNFDFVVIPASNFMYSGYDLSGMAAFVEKINLPCVMIGVGSQAPTYESKIVLQPGTRRFLEIVAERSVSIGVRGYFTASQMEKIGIKNIDIIGCPSFFWTCNPTLNVLKKPFSQVKNIAFNGSRNVIQHSSNPEKMKRIEGELLSQIMKYDSDFFVQNEYEESFLARKRQDEIYEGLFEPIVNYYGSYIQEKDIVEYFKNHSRIFFDITEWAQAISEYDFSIGTRFHGNMIAMQNGVPAVIIAHDVRTREMCELLHIPFLTIDEIDNISLEYVYKLADYSSINSSYNQLYNNYIRFLDKNKLSHCLRPEEKLIPGESMQSYIAIQNLLKLTRN